MVKTQWVCCPVCGNKTRTMVREDTELKNYPLFCPKCKQETLINVKQRAYRHLDDTPVLLYTLYGSYPVPVCLLILFYQ